MTKIKTAMKGDKDVTSKGSKEASPQKKGKENYGVRSYLHQFYLSPTREDVEGAEWLLPQNQQSPRGVYLCRAITILGFLLLIVGAATIIVAYTWPKQNLDQMLGKVNRDDEGGIWITRENLDLFLSDSMRMWKLIGLGVFTSGGILMAVSLLVPTIAQCAFGNNSRLAALGSLPETPAEPPIKIFADQSPTKEVPRSPVEKKVPVMEAISKVQPAEDEGRERKVSGDEMLLASSED